MLIVLCLGFVPLSFGALTGDKIEQRVDKDSIGVVHTGTGDIHIGITLEQYEDGLRRRAKEVTEQLEKAHNREREALQSQLDIIKKQTADIEQSYKNHIKDLQERISQLESIRGQVPDELLDQAQNALAKGDTEKADKLFQEVEKQSQGAIKAAAEANYQRCKIAGDAIKYQEALPLCERAVQLVPKNGTYLNYTGLVANTLGRFGAAKDYYEQALASDLKTYGEDHSTVAKDRNNLGSAWQALGDYQKAIVYLEQALASDLKTYGEDHPTVAGDRNNLGTAWHDLGDYQKAIVYLEQALASDLKTYGEDHPKVAIIRNNHGTAWLALGDYQKAIGCYEQALASDLKTYGEDHPQVAIYRNNLGSAWYSLGDYQKAIYGGPHRQDKFSPK
jgi:tetratricopeptide (TPR) repeat protein